MAEDRLRELDIDSGARLARRAARRRLRAGLTAPTSRAITSTACSPPRSASRRSRCGGGCCWSGRRFSSRVAVMSASAGRAGRRLRLAGRLLARLRPRHRVDLDGPRALRPTSSFSRPPAIGSKKSAVSITACSWMQISAIRRHITSSGTTCVPVARSPRSTSDRARMASRCGFRPRTTRSSTRSGHRAKSSSTPSTSRLRCSSAPMASARPRRSARHRRFSSSHSMAPCSPPIRIS